jgi:hypothetical protein
MNSAETPAKVTVKSRLLTSAEFQRLAEVPPKVEWFKPETSSIELPGASPKTRCHTVFDDSGGITCYSEEAQVRLERCR